MPDPTSLLAFAETAAGVAATTRKLEKAALLGAYFAALPDEVLALAARYFSERVFPLYDQRTLNVGFAQLRDAVLALVPASNDELRILSVRFGDMGDVVAELLTRRPPPEPSWTLLQLQTLFDELAATSGSKAKTRRLIAALAEWTPLEARYATKLMMGELRIGLREGLVEDTLARLYEHPLEAVSRANMLVGDIGETALRARHRTLSDARMHLFHPIKFMLASPIASPDELTQSFDPPYYVEDKYDGVRAQLHKDAAGRLAIFSRTLDEVSHRFPELREDALALPGDLLLDGEILGRRDGRALPFKDFQQRLGRKTVSAALLAKVPVVFVAFDLLYVDGRLYLDRPLAERREALERLPLRGAVRLSEMRVCESAEEAAARFEPARERGQEGLMIKDPRSLYKPGRRGQEWLKLKRPLATLDVVVTAVEWGHGKRRHLLSDYTFAVRAGEDDSTLLNVGKAYSGLTDAELAELTEWFKAHTIRDFGRVRLVEPRVVIEVAFDVVQPSPRHKSGYALRFPRIVRLRDDKLPSEIDTLETVRRLAGA